MCGGMPVPDLEIVDCDPTCAEAVQLVEALTEELFRLTGARGLAPWRAEHSAQPRGAFLVARAEGAPVGCGALRPVSEQVAEIKRMYAAQPGRGIGACVLRALEERARGLGYATIWLETRRVNEAAVQFYRRKGYNERPNYGVYVGREECVCFELNLADRPALPGAEATR